MNTDNTHISTTDMPPEDMEVFANGINAVFGKPMALHGTARGGRVHIATKEFRGTYSTRQLVRLIERNDIRFCFVYDLDSE